MASHARHLHVGDNEIHRRVCAELAPGVLAVASKHDVIVVLKVARDQNGRSLGIFGQKHGWQRLLNRCGGHPYLSPKLDLVMLSWIAFRAIRPTRAAQISVMIPKSDLHY